jgi:DNA replication protein DnaC
MSELERFEIKPTELIMCECGDGWLEPRYDEDPKTGIGFWSYSYCDACETKERKRRKQEDKQDAALKAARIGTRHIKATLADVDPCYVEDMADSVYFHGEPGFGKTHAIVAGFKYDLSKNVDAAFVNVGDLIARIKASFRPNPEEYDSDIIEHYASVRVLYLDDLGAEKATEFVVATLATIIDLRYRNELKTIITSNLTIKELNQQVGDRITSRIVGMCKIVEMKGKDRRLTERPKRPVV